MGDVTGPGREHHGAALPATLAGRDRVAISRGTHRSHLSVRPDGRRDHIGVPLDKADRLRHRAESIRIVSLIAVSWEATLPVGREQAQRVPPLGLPRVGHRASLENDVIDRALGEAPTHGQPGVASPDDDGSDALCQTTSTVTFVGFVMMS